MNLADAPGVVAGFTDAGGCHRFWMAPETSV